MLSDAEVDVLINKYKPQFIKSKQTHRRKPNIAPVISVLRKVYCVVHNDLDENARVERDDILEIFRGIFKSLFLLLKFFYNL